MKHSNYITILLSLLFLNSSCNKEWLDEKPKKNLAVPVTVKDFQAILDFFSNVNVNSTTIISEIAADGHYYTEAIWNTYKGTTNQNIYTWTNDVPYTSLSDWNLPYSAILNMNIVLTESEKQDMSNAGIAHVRAQALFQRSRIFLDLAQVFAPAYNPATAQTDLGIPLRLTNDITEASKRSSLQQTYQQIVTDIKKSIVDLPNTPDFLNRASKPAAFALLARTYLIMGDYENAGKSADQCLAIKNTLYNYSEISPTANFIGLNSEVLFVNLMLVETSLTSNYLIDRSLFDLYDANDLRKQFYFKSTNPAGIQFKGTYGNSQNDLFAGIALDEVYLIRAESYAREGNITLAMKYLNDLLRTRWAKNPNGTSKYIDQTASTETDALKLIFEERRKQLILRNVRWSDLKRYNLDNRFKVAISRTIGGNTYTLEPNSYKYTFPIPDEIIQLSGLKQNPGWDK